MNLGATRADIVLADSCIYRVMWKIHLNRIFSATGPSSKLFINLIYQVNFNELDASQSP